MSRVDEDRSGGTAPSLAIARVALGAVTRVDIDGYRAEARRFLLERERVYYRQLAGLSDTLEIEAVHRRYAGLFAPEGIAEIREAYEQAAPGSDLHRQRRILLDFAVNGYLEAQTAPLEEDRARREAELTVEIDGAQISYRRARGLVNNTADRAHRRALHDQVRGLMGEHLDPVAAEIFERHHAAARELGFSSYVTMCAELKGVDLEAVNQAARRFVARSTAQFAAIVEPELQASLGFGLDAMSQADFDRFGRAADLDHNFPADRLLSSLYQTFSGLGIDIRAQANVYLDVESRPNKTPGAFCAPVSSDEVYLVIAPKGGRTDFSSLFHEAGHTEHFAHMDRTLPFEYRYLGDYAITEGFAFLFQHLERNPLWLASQLGAAEPEAIRRRTLAHDAMVVRLYCARLAYELEFHAPDPIPDPKRLYAQLLSDAAGFAWSEHGYAATILPGFYCTAYLRAWALETHLRRVLTERFGEAWYEQPEAGEFLRKWWSAGQRLSAEEFLYDITGATLDFAVMLEDLELA